MIQGLVGLVIALAVGLAGIGGGSFTVPALVLVDSIRSLHYFQLLTFPTNRGTCFSLKGNSNLLKTMHFCTVGAQPFPGKGAQ